MLKISVLRLRLPGFAIDNLPPLINHELAWFAPIKAACSQIQTFRSSPQTTQSPLQSGLHKGLMGISNKKYSRANGARSILLSSGRMRPASVTALVLKAYSSLNTDWIGCKKPARQR